MKSRAAGHQGPECRPNFKTVVPKRWPDTCECPLPGSLPRSLQTERQGFTYKKLYKEPGARCRPESRLNKQPDIVSSRCWAAMVELRCY